MRRTQSIIAVIGLFLFAQAARADWTPAKRLSRTSGESLAPAMATDSANTIHVVWEDDSPGNHEIYYKNGN